MDGNLNICSKIIVLHNPRYVHTLAETLLLGTNAVDLRLIYNAGGNSLSFVKKQSGYILI